MLAFFLSLRSRLRRLARLARRARLNEASRFGGVRAFPARRASSIIGGAAGAATFRVGADDVPGAPAVLTIARRAAGIALLPRPSDREIAARHVARRRAEWQAARAAEAACAAPIAAERVPTGSAPCR